MKMTQCLVLALAAGAFTLPGCDAEESMGAADQEGLTPGGPAVPGIEEEDPHDDLELMERVEEANDASELIGEAASTLDEMKTVPGLRRLMSNAKGLLLVPDYGRAAVGVGVGAGEGVFVARLGDGWTAPALYDLGRVNVGAQIGAEGGDIGMLLMTQRAVDAFEADTFTLDADAKLTLVDYSTLTGEVLSQDEDVVFWSGTEGVFAGVALGATGISWDDDENHAFHGQRVTLRDILRGNVKPQASALQRGLSDL